MRRLVQTLLLALPSLFLFVLPAAAASEEGPKPPAEGFGSGQWDGLLLALVLGIIMGLVVFIDAYGAKDDEATGHADHGHH